MKYLFFLLPLFILACPKLENNSNDNQNSIEGNWKWIESSFMTRGMSEPRISTPESMGYEIELKINSSTIDVMKDGKKMETYNYEIKKMSPDDQLFLDLKIQHGNNLPEYGFRLSSGPCEMKNGMLEITGGYNDAGENQKFKRI